MKAITEDFLRTELRNTQPDTYYIPEGKILTPAAREYLLQRKMKIAKQEDLKTADAPEASAPSPAAGRSETIKARFVDYNTGGFYQEKPEHMTHLYGNVLVPKNHPRILFRGKLDSLQSLVVLDQILIAEGGKRKLVDDLGNLLNILREIMRCDVLDLEYCNDTVIGLTHAALREQSHDPKKFFGVQPMLLPDHTMGKEYALLNQLRSSIRETEVAAVDAFQEGIKYTRKDIIEELNRLSSAVHIMMCMYLAGRYR